MCVSDREDPLQELLHRLPDGAPAQAEPGPGGPCPLEHRPEGPGPDGEPTQRGGLPGLLLHQQEAGERACATSSRWGCDVIIRRACADAGGAGSRVVGETDPQTTILCVAALHPGGDQPPPSEHLCESVDL